MNKGLSPARTRVSLVIAVTIGALLSAGIAWAGSGGAGGSGGGDGSSASAAGPLADSAAKRKGKKRNRLRRYRGPRIKTKNSARCDWLDLRHCLLPFPNNRYTTKAATPTGLRVNLKAFSMPRNVLGTPIDPTEFNRNDGFSPGSPILVHVPGMDNQRAFNRSGIVPVTNIRAYANRRQPVVLIDTVTKKRHPIFAELDSRAPNNSLRHLIIRPTVNLEEGRRYIVALRNLKRAKGRKFIRPKNAFRVYRNRLKTRQRPVEKRRKKMEGIFKTLRKSGIPRKNLYLAWDFTVASEQNLAGRVLAMRNDAFADLGDSNLADGIEQGDSPNFNIEVGDVEEFLPCDAGLPGCEPGEDEEMFRRIEGTVEVPCYLTHPTSADECAPGARFAFSGAADLFPNLPQGQTTDVVFQCIIPHSVDGGGAADPARPVLYGHGLLGAYTQASNSVNQQFALDHNLIFCGPNWAGFSEEDTGPTIIPALADLSRLPKAFDRTQQGYVNFMMLGRAMMQDDGLMSDPAFRADFGGGEESLIDGSNLFFQGISQGGIMGGALTALAPDFTRSSLDVNGMNYANLLERSVDFDEYAAILWPNYPNYNDRQLVLSILQMVWDRGDANGFAHHMTTDPYAGTPQHRVLMHVAYGDHQVSNLTAEIEARTVGARIVMPALKPGRHWESNPYFGLTPLTAGQYPFGGSALVYYDGGPASFNGTIGLGTDKSPTTNQPNRTGDDPHGYPRRSLDAQAQNSLFWDTGLLTGPCGILAAPAAPCFSNGYL